ncbi:MAG: adenylosuccinate synthetase [Candidatus Saganbacteria bacterium]|nr:adenylosuccinate synthetase [Candidatus Saganbacteria bacterium]
MRTTPIKKISGYQRPPLQLAHLDLVPGDAGKGTTVHFSSKQIRDIYGQAPLNSRTNGSVQAAHTVFDEFYRGHVFMQFGAGTFVDGVNTWIPSTMLVEPEMLIVEELALKGHGVRSPIRRLNISENSPVVLKYHKMLCQMLESSRGKNRFGSVGFGIGQAVLDNKRKDRLGIVFKDLLNETLLREKLMQLLPEKIAMAEKILAQSAPEGKKRTAEIYQQFSRYLDINYLMKAYLNFGYYFEDNVVGEEFLMNSILAGVPTVFEISQGAMLDPRWAFKPYVTKTPTTIDAVTETIKRSSDTAGEKLETDIRKIGVLRAFYNRHGAGPMVTEIFDERIRTLLRDREVDNEWQGNFRVGWLDLPALRYAVALNQGLDYLSVTCVDRLQGIGPIKVCTSYEYEGDFSDLSKYFHWERISRKKARILGFKEPDLANPPAEDDFTLTTLIQRCRPLDFVTFGKTEEDMNSIKYFEKLPQNIRELLDFISGPDGINIPIGLVSVGRSYNDKFLVAPQMYREKVEVESSPARCCVA